MSLAKLIKKGSLRWPATATVATFATHEQSRPPTVATVATVAVAIAPDTAANDPAPTPNSAAVDVDLIPQTCGQVLDTAALDPDRHCWPHSPAMNTAEIDRFTARLARFTDRGVILSDAECLADKLVIRDRQRDDRAMCMECRHLQRGGRCGNWQRAGVAIRAWDAQLATEFVNLLQRCNGFTQSIHFQGGNHGS